MAGISRTAEDRAAVGRRIGAGDDQTGRTSPSGPSETVSQKAEAPLPGRLKEYAALSNRGIPDGARPLHLGHDHEGIEQNRAPARHGNVVLAAVPWVGSHCSLRRPVCR
jgi:hypothetical protein